MSSNNTWLTTTLILTGRICIKNTNSSALIARNVLLKQLLKQMLMSIRFLMSPTQYKFIRKYLVIPINSWCKMFLKKTLLVCTTVWMRYSKKKSTNLMDSLKSSTLILRYLQMLILVLLLYSTVSMNRSIG